MIVNDFIIPEDLFLSTTLKHMDRLVNQSLINPDFNRFVLLHFKGSDPWVISYSIWEWLRKNVNYVADNPDELLIAPYNFINEGYGDCDDYSMFTYAVAKLKGLKPAYVLLGTNDEGYSHVAVQVEISPGENILIDGCNPFFNKVNYKKYNNLKVLSCNMDF